MLRVAFLSIFLLAGISSGIVYTQWHNYEESSSGEKHTTLVHDFVLRRTGDELEITQQLRGRIAKNYEIFVPKAITNLSCQAKGKQTCKIYTKQGRRYLKTDGLKEVQLHYVVALPKKVPSLWLESWFVAFRTEQAQQFNVQLFDFTGKGGMWVAGAPLEGQVKRDHFTLYAWSKKMHLPFLFIFIRSNLREKFTEKQKFIVAKI